MESSVLLSLSASCYYCETRKRFLLTKTSGLDGDVAVVVAVSDCKQNVSFIVFCMWWKSGPVLPSKMAKPSLVLELHNGQKIRMSRFSSVIIVQSLTEVG